MTGWPAEPDVLAHTVRVTGPDRPLGERLTRDVPLVNSRHHQAVKRLADGMELAMSCDLVIATGDARFAQPEIEVGCYPPVASALLPQRIGAGRDLPFPQALAETERIYKEELLPLEDLAEGAAAFLEKRRAVWRHR